MGLRSLSLYVTELVLVTHPPAGKFHALPPTLYWVNNPVLELLIQKYWMVFLSPQEPCVLGQISTLILTV